MKLCSKPEIMMYINAFQSSGVYFSPPCARFVEQGFNTVKSGKSGHDKAQLAESSSNSLLKLPVFLAYRAHTNTVDTQHILVEHSSARV